MSHIRSNEFRFIDSDADLEADIVELGRIEPRFVRARESTGPLSIRRYADGYARIVRAIVGQQISVAAAEGIWQRMADHNLDTLETIASSDIESLRSIGLSRQKASYLLALADANIDFDALRTLSDQTVRNTLTAVKGIGDWTAEIYMMFALGRADIFAHGDLALQESAKLLFSLAERPTAREIKTLAEAWSPYRNAAAQLLWAHYRVAKGRSGI